MPNDQVIPNLPPLSSIEDKNVRVALEALTTAWRVRNGEVGDGQEKFLTAKDLEDAVSNVRIIGTNTLGDGTNGGLGNAPPTNRWIASLLERIDASIAQSYLYRLLSDRLEWIETPDWFAGKFGAAIKTEQIQRQTETAALASAVNTVITNINGNLAHAQTQLTATSDLAGATAKSLTTLQTEVGGVRTIAQNAFTLSQSIDGQIRGAWTVKFDANGYVAGAGLSLEGRGGHYSSAFYVKADRFAIGNPDYPGVAPRIPFKVFSTSQTLPDGTTVPAGVYMDEATVYKLNGTYISAGTMDAGEIYTGSTWLDRYSKLPIVSQPFGYYSLPGEGHPASYVRTGGSMRFYGPGLHGSAPLQQRVRGSQYGGNLTFIINASCTADHWFSLWYRINGNDYWVPAVYRYTWSVVVNGYYTVYATTEGTSPVAPNLVGTYQYDGDGNYIYVTSQQSASLNEGGWWGGGTQQIGGGYTASTATWNWISKTVEPQNDFGTASVVGSVTVNVPNSAWWIDFGVTITNEAYSVMNSGDGKNFYIRDMYMYAFTVNV